MIDLILKSTRPYKWIFVSNLKDENDKSDLANFGNNEKYLIDDMYYN